MLVLVVGCCRCRWWVVFVVGGVGVSDGLLLWWVAVVVVTGCGGGIAVVDCC